jgi:negative regulator of sigma E activity
VSIDQHKLMQYFDGELDDEQAAEVEALLENDVEARRVLEGIDQVGAVLRGVMLEQARPPEDLTERVMARVSAEQRPRRAWVGLRERPAVRRGVPIALGALAAAAALALVFERANPPAPRISTPAPPTAASRAPSGPSSSWRAWMRCRQLPSKPWTSAVARARFS